METLKFKHGDSCAIDLLFNEYDAAIHLAMSVSTLRRWRLFRTGPVFVKVGGKAVRYRVTDLKAFIDIRQTAPRKKGALSNVNYFFASATTISPEF